jgi:hypothetical protein
MYYANASITVSDIVAQNNTYTFQTVSAAVELRDSQGGLIDTGTVKYYSGGWRDFGTTENGSAVKELLPKQYSFRMYYENASIDKQQDIFENGTVTFSTVACTVLVTDTSLLPLESASIKFYAGGWCDFGTTGTDGIAVKELLPKAFGFRAAYGSARADKQQDISVNPLVEIQLNTQ